MLMEDSRKEIIDSNTAALLSNWLKENHEMCEKRDVTWNDALSHVLLLKREIINGHTVSSINE